MKPSDHLTKDLRSWCMAQEGEQYIVFIPPGLRTTSLNIGQLGNKYSVQWYNPREGAMKKGSVRKVKGGGFVELRIPPSDKDKDLVVIIRK